MSNKIIFFLSIALLVVVVLYWKSCHKSTLTPPTQSDKTVDSIINKAISDSIITKAKVDSLSKGITVLSRVKDSLLSIITISKGDLRGKDKDIQALIEEINKAGQMKDTLALLVDCDSLKRAYPVAKGLVTQYIRSNDSLIKVNDLIIKNKDTIIGRLSASYNESNSMLFETSRLYGNVSAETKTLLKQSGKKWGIGPGFGASVIDGKIKPVISFSIHYDLFKF